ncbi:hypothetical protein ACOSQ2_027027 [Xanthoceras sorbifolium]
MITTLIKYERLPDFCYGCGFIGHSFRECYNSGVRKNIMEGVEPKFGGWFRASPLDRSKFRGGSRNVQERLDRFFATSQWVNLFSGIKVKHLGFMFSDHRPISAKFVRGGPSGSGGGDRKFRFEPF